MTSASSEQYLTLPDSLEGAHQGYRQYTALPTLTQPHSLDGEMLTQYHHSMIASTHPKHLLSGAWCQVELAHVRDYEGSRAEAQELLVMAGNRASRCHDLVAHDYSHPEYYDRLYRSRLLALYVEHFAQIGPVDWPDETTLFQRTAYERVQRVMVNPLLDDYRRFKGDSSEAGQRHLVVLKRLLSEMKVLQCLNRLQAKLVYPEWAVAPASSRENRRTRSESIVPVGTSQAFDIKLTFADQTFIPLEARWHQPESVQQSRQVRRRRKQLRPDDKQCIAVVYANSGSVAALPICDAMRREVDGVALRLDDERRIVLATASILRNMEIVGRQGVSRYGDGSIEAAAAELSLSALYARFAEIMPDG